MRGHLSLEHDHAERTSGETPMSNQRNADRRTVLQTIGAGVAGILGTSGSVAAASVPIRMRGFNFDPKRTSIDVGDAPVRVQWRYDEVTNSEPPHNVVIATDRREIQSDDDHGTGLVQSEFIMSQGDTYTVEFEKSDSNLAVREVGGKPGVDANETAHIDLESGMTLAYVCSHHAANMWGVLEVTD